MSRALALVAVLALSCAAQARADQISGKVKSVDADNKQLVLIVGGSEKSYKVSDDAKVVTVSGKEKKPTFTPIAGGIAGLKEGTDVVCFADTADTSRLVEVRVQGSLKKKKKNK